jgi:hypothetical protein
MQDPYRPPTARHHGKSQAGASRVLWWLAVLLLPTVGVSWADELATFSDGVTAIALRTEPCGPMDSEMQRAVKHVDALRLDGCWTMNRRGNPIVLWNDGTVQELDESRLALAPRYLALLKELDTQRLPPHQPSPTSDFRRAFWCKDASFPHERLICRDEHLARADLALSPLWRSYRQEMRLSGAEERRVKSDYFRRLKACGAEKACIAREQAAQERFYREALGKR